MIDLRERLQELADAATRDGITPGPAHAIRRGRRRRHHLAGGIASVLVLALVAGVAGVAGRLPDRPASRPVAPATPPSTTLPPVVVQPGPPSDAIESQLWEDIKTSLGECGVRNAGGPRLLARGTAYGQRWILGGRPPRRVDGKGMCWAFGQADPRGGEGVGTSGTARSPTRAVVASGSSGATFGSVDGYVTKRAARVRVVFNDGRPPLEVDPLESGRRFPVNFYLAFFPLQGRPEDWVVARIEALDRGGRVVASCRTGPLPEGTCAER
jgi:hypothetical protein